ncbi:L,D-transpeptidase family protein [Clostridium celatum]|uniref:ErfK/YbiS/YcfS/YnhG n=1 Tax=Clostridium celatum DSM 1785 TaxID=545697 RepID=L1QLK8_9CLOT|nr:L,D-transpeptidase family protein [Clostridium celatum]EKY28806.1 ErfK/YbiS/YcfS/YnhG [Clostridium celatum DSM 1785]MCE9656728.1 L,D-transpeptidase/peptidoglycan binding protein [Clostridium celatum]MDU6297291.1 peptidoglycan binding domain-containing protein [Clostridium celatum]MDY3360408.1 peptidoglycan binding domain-containing protein [Clostridium celatum]
MVNNKKSPIFNILILFCSLLSIYFVIVIYFSNHFFVGTSLNNINLSCKTIKEANVILNKFANNYTIELKERGGLIENISGSDINFKYNSKEKLQEIKNNQNPYLWPLLFFQNNKYVNNEIFSYDNSLFNEQFEKLNCFKEENIIEPQNATLKFNGSEYYIIDEVYGNKINKDFLHAYILNSIYIGTKSLVFDDINCYEDPKFIATSEKVLDTKDTLNNYVNTRIYYTFDDTIEILDGNTINTWLDIDDSFNIIFDNNKIDEYLKSLGDKYNTYGKAREFKTTTKKNITVIGGNYGWRINRSKEREALINDIKNGENIIKEPIYLQKALGTRENDIGSTYVEINLTNQYLWFYKDGDIVAQGDIVSGNESRGLSTPVGTYILNYKQKDATLKGAGYSSKVSYWMPFNSNIGLHDATWRNDFGGNIYKSNGSHGCINLPVYLAKKIYENIEPGTPIICYTE